ncbi:DAK2 domain-containing protein [Nocardia sp. NPDC049190]|uniref:DAK2 domain-containing protein n=1 Tax=Nocardia sp. NPDC049190 TaxID=3155650 RepID=UPI0033C3B77A
MADGREVTVPDVREVMDGTALLRWGRACLEGLETRRQEINALNVFPIPDADTGTNLLATLRAAVAAAEVAVFAAGTQAGGAPAHTVAAAMAHGATVGARGNSGIIISQVLRGIADAVRDGPLTADTLRVALTRASALVRAALSVPIEGTILTVLDRASRCASDCMDVTLAGVALAAADGAVKALGDTPSQLGVLRDAGVVDAGARGLVVLLDSLVAVTLGEVPARPEYARRVPDAVRPAYDDDRSAYDDDDRPVAEPRYEVMYLLADTDASRVAALQTRLGKLGDSVAVVGDGGRWWSVHVHCADAGAAVEAGIAAGTLSRLRIESFTLAAYHESGPGHGADAPIRVRGRGHNGLAGADVLVSCRGKNVGADIHVAHPAGADARDQRSAEPDADQVDAAEAVVAATSGSGPALPGSGDVVAGALAVPGAAATSAAAADRGIIAVAAGEGAATLFEDAGAVVLGGEEPVTAQTLLAAIRRMPNREVLVLPNGALPAHELVAVGVAARDAHRDVLLLPSASVVQGLAALAVHDRERIAVDDAFAMSEAAATTRWGSLRAATQRALTMVGTCAPGDGLGLVGHDVVVIDRDVRAAGPMLLDRMLAVGGELVTLLMGATAPDGLGTELAAHIAQGFPGVEVIVYSGGQRVDLVQIGVE